MIFADTSDIVQIFTALFLFLTALSTGILTYLTIRLKAQQDATREAVEKGKNANAQVLGTISQGVVATHQLVNSQSGQHLKMYALMARRMAEMTGEQVDNDAATMADKMLVEHDQNQRKVDEKSKKEESAKMSILPPPYPYD